MVKRSGQHAPCSFDKVIARLSRLAYGLNADYCDPVRPTQLAAALRALSSQIHCQIPGCSLTWLAPALLQGLLRLTDAVAAC